MLLLKCTIHLKDNIAGYADIVDWWAQMVSDLNKKRNGQGLKNIKLYIAHGIYKYRDAKDQFNDSGEIINQIKYTKKYDSIVGSAFYSYETLYQFASKTHENGVKYLRNNWANNPVYPINRGENDSAGLKIDNYKISFDKLTNKYILNFDKQPGFRAYGLYKVLKNEPFDANDLTTRELVKYDPYVTGPKGSVEIEEYDDNYDYYVKVVSSNGYLSSETTKLEFSKVEEVESIKINSLSEIPQQVLKNSKVEMKANITNITGKNLKYKVWCLENGVDRGRLLTSGDVKGSELVFTFTSYNYDVKNAQIKFEVTDGVSSAYQISNMFDIVSKMSIDFTVNINTYSVKAPNDINISISINGNVGRVPYMVIVKDENGDTIEVIANDYVTENDMTFTWHVSDASHKEVYVYVMIGSNVNTYTSNPIAISETPKAGANSCNFGAVSRYLVAMSMAFASVIILLRKRK